MNLKKISDNPWEGLAGDEMYCPICRKVLKALPESTPGLAPYQSLAFIHSGPSHDGFDFVAFRLGIN